MPQLLTDEATESSIPLLMFRPVVLVIAGSIATFCAPLARGVSVDRPALVEPSVDPAARRIVIDSEFLGRPMTIEVFLPRSHLVHRERRYRVLYVLAAEPGDGPNRGLLEVARRDLHDRFDLIAVGVNFDTTPWYGAHATDLKKRHEEYLLRSVLPAVDAEFPTRREPGGRLLLGFSKSGWGAFTLLLRHPEVFGYAASWDAPLLFSAADFGTYETDVHFGTAESFARYLPTTLLREHASELQGRPRLVLAGSELFGSAPDGRFARTPHTEGAHRLMSSLGIRHFYNPQLAAKHRWNSGWFEPLLTALVAAADGDPPSSGFTSE